MANGSTQMIRTATLDRATERLTPAAAAHRGDDKAMLKAAANLTRDLNVPKPPVYWADMIGSALLGAIREEGSDPASLVKSLWVERMSRVASEAEGMVAELVRMDGEEV